MYMYIATHAYTAPVPQKTIYVAEADLELYQRAQAIADGNLSAAITQALRRMVDLEDAKGAGFDDVTVQVGVGKGRRQRFAGVLLLSWQLADANHVVDYRVWRTRKGQFAVHMQKGQEHVWTAGKDGTATGWRKHFASDQQYGVIPEHATLEVFEDVEAMRGKLPEELVRLVESVGEHPLVEDLDI